MADDFSERCGDLLTGSYDCAGRVVLNACFPPGRNPGGFRSRRRRLHDGSDEKPDDAHLMRTAGRLARRVKARGKAGGVPVTCCTAGQRRHLIAGEYPETRAVTAGVFLILAAKAPATVRKVRRSTAGTIVNTGRKREHVCRCSFRITDPASGHLTVTMSGHPPFGAQVILNGHEYVAVAAQAGGTGFTKEGNCFTGIADPQRLARVAGAWPHDAATGRLGQVCDRRTCTGCLVFGLDLEERERSGFRYGYPACRAGYSRNLLFRSGAQTGDPFGRVPDRTRSRPGIPVIRTLFGLKTRPHRTRRDGPPAPAIFPSRITYGVSPRHGALQRFPQSGGLPGRDVGGLGGVAAGGGLRQAGPGAEPRDVDAVAEPGQRELRLQVAAQLKPSLRVLTGLFPCPDRTAAGGEQGRGEPDELAGDVGHDRIRGHAGPSGRVISLARPRSTEGPTSLPGTSCHVRVSPRDARWQIEISRDTPQA